MDPFLVTHPSPPYQIQFVQHANLAKPTNGHIRLIQGTLLSIIRLQEKESALMVWKLAAQANSSPPILDGTI
jgi:hypothetical protein